MAFLPGGAREYNAAHRGFQGASRPVNSSGETKDGRAQEIVGAAGWPGLQTQAGYHNVLYLISWTDAQTPPETAPSTVAGRLTATVCLRGDE
jgi:hypothetical protein